MPTSATVDPAYEIRVQSATEGSSIASSYDHLRALEAESLHIIREVVAEFERPVMLLSSIGKDSSGPAAARPEGVSPRPDPVSAAARRHDVQVPRDYRVPRPVRR